MALDEVPEPVPRGRVGRAFVHEARRAVGERAVHEIGVARHPADVGGAPVDVVVLEVEDPLRGRVDPDEIAGRRVQDALRLARRARRVQDVERVLGVHLLGIAGNRRRFHQPVPPVLASLVKRDRRARAPHDDDVLDRRRSRERLVGDLLQRHHVASPPAAVRRDEEPRALVVDPVAQRLGREAPEDDRVDRPDPRAGEHRDRELRDHREVERDAVALADPEAPQDVGELGDLAVEVAVGQRPLVPRFPFPDQRGLVFPSARQVPVEAVDGHVQLSPDEPLRLRRFPVEDPLPRPEPRELLREVGPELLEVPVGLAVDRGASHMSVLREAFRRGESALLEEERFEGLGRCGHGGEDNPGVMPFSRVESGILRCAQEDFARHGAREVTSPPPS